ncbi:MAG: riboflavin synthase [Elusimicrobiota bacterium]|jgi:riboflavin synthase|nr:riboflavin synthase [Elusimicrobiota bacterium]
MFTGIIEDIGTVQSISDSRICIESNLGGIKKGDSISINGVCLTVVFIDKNFISFDYSPRTDKITNLSSLKPNSKVNLERALTLSTRLGGHIVSGHIDSTAKIKNIQKLDKFFKVDFSCGQEILKHCADRGSIAIDGISLTIAESSVSGFSVFIIPETFNNTIMQFKKPQDSVNIETDILAKYIEKIISGGVTPKGISLEVLKDNGFI